MRAQQILKNSRRKRIKVYSTAELVFCGKQVALRATTFSQRRSTPEVSSDKSTSEYSKFEENKYM